MHPRRVAACLLGAWLFGILLVWFVVGQSEMNVDRLVGTPAIAKEIELLGPEGARRLLEQQAVRLNRHVVESWSMVQLGIGGALIAASVLTAHRSRVVAGAAVVMTMLAAVSAFYIAPELTASAQAAEIRPTTEGEQLTIRSLEVWQRSLEIVKMLIGAALAARLLIDRAAWRPDSHAAHYRNTSSTRPTNVRRSDG